MSPETSLTKRNVLEESARISHTLLEVQAQVDAAALATEDSLLSNIRQELGYTNPPNINTKKIIDVNISDKVPVVTPHALATVLPLSRRSLQTTRKSRKAISDIIQHKDDRLIAIVGPCSIHDPNAALEYASHVKNWRSKYGEELEIVMRAYMEKPRSEKDWKGFIYDPLLDESDDINLGVIATRMLACQITNSGVPIAVERLNALTPQYLNGLVAYDAIGARNVTDQKAREYASGTSSPVGFKNTTDGNIFAAVQAVISARSPHAFLGMGMNGTPHQINTKGNRDAHIILRGSDSGPNYESRYVTDAANIMKSNHLEPSELIDCNHGNSGKKANRQRFVNAAVCAQVRAGETAIRGVMIEGNLVFGNQKRRHQDGTLKHRNELVYGQSITDECVDLDQTEAMLKLLAQAAHDRKLAA